MNKVGRYFEGTVVSNDWVRYLLTSTPNARITQLRLGMAIATICVMALRSKASTLILQCVKMEL